jgi:methionyl-tRNA formyltransferase
MTDLRVDLAAFQGPLDLLLHLVQQEEVDIHEVSVARIADRFLETCRSQVQSLDVDEAGEYLVLASQLLLLKSRALLPRDTPMDLEEIDPRLDLVKQLLEYRDFKRVSEELEAYAVAQGDRQPVHVMGPERKSREDVEIEVDLYALVSTFQRLLKETGEDTAVAVPRERLPITHFVEVMFDRLLDQGGNLTFEELLVGHRDRTYVIGAFLALLELIKLRKIRVLQDGFGEIRVQIREEGVEMADAVEGDLAAEALDRPEMGGAQRLRVVFMGSPDFAVQVLEHLVEADMTPILIVTPPMRPTGRGRRRREVPVARAAERFKIPIHRTSNVNVRDSREAVQAATPDVVVTAGFGQKLGSGILTLPPKGCINVHGSLLPSYRGASPVAAALRDGAPKTGVTLFVMDEELDHGPIIATQEMALEGDETADEVMTALGELGAELLVRTLPDYVAGNIEPQPQDHEQATYARRMKKDAGRVSWDASALEVKNHVRSVTSWPGAQTAWQPKVKHDPFPVLLVETEVLDPGEPPVEGEEAAREGPPPGTVQAVSSEGIDVLCGRGVLRILRLCPSGGRVMAVKDFLNARRVVAGDRFVTPSTPGD